MTLATTVAAASEPFVPVPTPDAGAGSVVSAEPSVGADQIAGLFGYRLWAETDRAEVAGKAGVLARRDVTATFILTELLALLTARRIVRPGYTTLQAIIGEVLMAERRRLEHLVEADAGHVLDTGAEELHRGLLADRLAEATRLMGFPALAPGR